MLFKSRYPPSEPPSEFKDSVSLYFWRQLDRYAERTLLVDYLSGREWTGAQIRASSQRCAHYLIEQLQMQARDRTVMLIKHSDRALVAALSVLFAGGSVCSWAYDDVQQEHAYMLDKVRPRVVFAERCVIRTLLALRRAREPHADHSAPFEYTLIMMDDDVDVSQDEETPVEREFIERHVIGLNKRALCYAAASSGAHVALPVVVPGDEAAFVLMTSGTTGRPKYASRSHRNSLYVCHSLDTAPGLWDLNENSVLAGHLPLDHGTGTFCLKMTLARGLKMIVMDYYRPEMLLHAIDKHRITDCLLGSALLHNLMSDLMTTTSNLSDRRYDLSSLRNLIAIGSPIASHALARDFMDKHEGVCVRQAFGMTECGFLSIVRREDARDDTPNVGYVLPNVELRLVDAQTGVEVNEPERVGVMHVRGPTVSPGYLGQESVVMPIDAEGFYASNDLSMVLRDGRLRVCGRRSEVMCVGDGWKVLPRELELLLLEHPAVREAAVIGLPNPHMPTCHMPCAFVVLKEDARCSADELRAYSDELLSEPKRLVGGVRVVRELPYISIGKVNKRALFDAASTTTTTTTSLQQAQQAQHSAKAH